jgi:hypothetical protein
LDTETGGFPLSYNNVDGNSYKSPLDTTSFKSTELADPKVRSGGAGGGGLVDSYVEKNGDFGGKRSSGQLEGEAANNKDTGVGGDSISSNRVGQMRFDDRVNPRPESDDGKSDPNGEIENISRAGEVEIKASAGAEQYGSKGQKAKVGDEPSGSIDTIEKSEKDKLGNGSVSTDEEGTNGIVKFFGDTGGKTVAPMLNDENNAAGQLGEGTADNRRTEADDVTGFLANTRERSKDEEDDGGIKGAVVGSKSGIANQDIPAKEISSDDVDGELKAGDQSDRTDTAAKNEDGEGQSVGVTDARSGKGAGMDSESSSITKGEGFPRADENKLREDIDAIKEDVRDAGTVSKSDDSTEAFAGSKRQTQGDDVQTAVQAQTDGDGDGELDTDAAMGQVRAELLVMLIAILVAIQRVCFSC